METREITIRVDADAAKAYPAASPEEREKIDLLLSLRLSQVTGPSTPLEQVMREISEAAQKRGLTEEMLSETAVRSNPRCVSNTNVLVSAFL